MNAENALEAFAAISVGVAGFSAIVVALAANTVLYDSRRLTWALGIIFGWSLGAMLFSILPFIFHFFGMTELVVWRVGLLVMGVFMAVVGTVVLYGDRRLNRVGLSMVGRAYDTPTKRSREMSVAKYVYILTATMLIAAGIWQPIPGYYLVGMTIMLMLSLWVLLFVFFVIGFSKKRADR
jgi:MFS family permease